MSNLKAFPNGIMTDEKGLIIGGQQGMDLRDWFAGMAMLATISSLEESFGPEEFNDMAIVFYRMADRMMKARENKDE